MLTQPLNNTIVEGLPGPNTSSGFWMHTSSGFLDALSPLPPSSSSPSPLIWLHISVDIIKHYPTVWQTSTLHLWGGADLHPPLPLTFAWQDFWQQGAVKSQTMQTTTCTCIWSHWYKVQVGKGCYCASWEETIIINTFSDQNHKTNTW